MALIFAGLNFTVVIRHKILLLIILTVFFLLILGFFIFYFLKRQKVKKLFGKRIGEIFGVVIREIGSYNEKGGKIWKAVLISFAFNFVGLAGANLALFRSLGISVGIADYLSVIFLISIVSSVPITINNIGIKEWAYISFFGFFGINPSAVISVAILSRIIQMMISFLALPIYLSAKRKKGG